VATAAAALSVASTGAFASGSGVPHQKRLSVRVAGKACKNSVINGINDSGTAVGTEYCGVATAFTRTRSGKTTLYSLPTHDAKFTLASNIASNGTLAVDGSHTKKGRVTSFLVSKSGAVTVLADPNAGSFSTIVNGVNDKSEAVGYYCINKKCLPEVPFVYKNGQFHDFRLNATRILPNLSEVTDSGALLGFFAQRPSDRIRSFIKTGGKVQVIDAPGALTTSAGYGTYLIDASNNGTICGQVYTSKTVAKGFVRYKGHFHEYDLYPTAKNPGTDINACNSHGLIGGTAAKGSGGIAFTGKL
jgi:hypothetical protein